MPPVLISRDGQQSYALYPIEGLGCLCVAMKPRQAEKGQEVHGMYLVPRPPDVAHGYVNEAWLPYDHLLLWEDVGNSFETASIIAWMLYRGFEMAQDGKWLFFRWRIPNSPSLE